MGWSTLKPTLSPFRKCLSSFFSARIQNVIMNCFKFCFQFQLATLRHGNVDVEFALGLLYRDGKGEAWHALSASSSTRILTLAPCPSTLITSYDPRADWSNICQSSSKRGSPAQPRGGILVVPEGVRSGARGGTLLPRRLLHEGRVMRHPILASISWMTISICCIPHRYAISYIDIQNEHINMLDDHIDIPYPISHIDINPYLIWILRAIFHIPYRSLISISHIDIPIISCDST